MRILVSGTFDDLHPGHLFLLNEASKRGELWVIVGRDRNVQTFKGRAPLQTEDHRKKAIEDAFPQAHVVLGDASDFLKPVREIQPDLILLGYDQILPPSIKQEDFPWNTERLPAFEPHIHKSSLRRAL
jgi:FAD synthetase